MSNKLSVAIIYGGKSVEHQISINSAKNIFEYIDRDKYDPIAIGISPQGDWFLKESIGNQFEGQQSLALVLSTTNKGFKNVDNGELIKPDVIFPVLHGTDGEAFQEHGCSLVDDQGGGFCHAAGCDIRRMMVSSLFGKSWAKGHLISATIDGGVVCGQRRACQVQL